jgi:hypothetical protein
MKTELQFGAEIINVDLDRVELQDLLHSRANELSTIILNAVKERVIAELRSSITQGNMNMSQMSEGYLQCLEDFAEFFTTHLPESLKSE